MPFLENAQLLRERIKKLKDLEAKKDIASNASEKGKKVRTLREALTSHRARASVLGLREGSIPWPDAATAQVALNEYKTALDAQKDPSEPTVEEAYKTLIKTTVPIDAEAAALIDPLIAEERATLAAIDRSALDAWKALKGDARQIDATLSELDRLLKIPKAQWLKLTPALLESALKAKAGVVNTVDGLMAVAMPPEVQTFLKHARQGGATPEHFTDTVKTWLASNKQLGRVRVVFK